MSLKFDLHHPLRDFDLNLSGEFHKGITGIFGPSGAGKTTFFNLLSGLEKPESGYVTLNERILTDVSKGLSLPVHCRRIGYVFQDNLLFPHLSNKENLLFGMHYALRKSISIEEVIDFLELKKLLKSKPSDISGGEQQRVALGRALLTSPDLLLLDEPFSNLDYRLRTSILSTIKELESRLNIPIIVISHDRDDLKYLTDRICMISRGKQRGFSNLLGMTSVKTG